MGRLSIPLIAALAALTIADPAVAASDYAALVVDILIVRQCGLSDELVEAGFRLQAEELTATGTLTPADAAAARERGQAIYRSTWRDRGAGAVDPRCRAEGAAAAAAFRAYILSE
jgi:hypothetical protein